MEPQTMPKLTTVSRGEGFRVPMKTKLTTIEAPKGEHWPNVGLVQVRQIVGQPTADLDVLLDGKQIGRLLPAQRPSQTRSRGPVKTWQPTRYKIDHHTYTKRWEAVRVVLTDHLGY
jgi:hypothetical protein